MPTHVLLAAVLAFSLLALPGGVLGADEEFCSDNWEDTKRVHCNMDVDIPVESAVGYSPDALYYEAFNTERSVRICILEEFDEELRGRTGIIDDKEHTVIVFNQSKTRCGTMVTVSGLLSHNCTAVDDKDEEIVFYVYNQSYNMPLFVEAPQITIYANEILLDLRLTTGNKLNVCCNSWVETLDQTIQTWQMGDETEWSKAFLLVNYFKSLQFGNVIITDAYAKKVGTKEESKEVSIRRCQLRNLSVEGREVELDMVSDLIFRLHTDLIYSNINIGESIIMFSLIMDRTSEEANNSTSVDEVSLAGGKYRSKRRSHSTEVEIIERTINLKRNIFVSSCYVGYDFEVKVNAEQLTSQFKDSTFKLLGYYNTKSPVRMSDINFGSVEIVSDSPVQVNVTSPNVSSVYLGFNSFTTLNTEVKCIEDNSPGYKKVYNLLGVDKNNFDKEYGLYNESNSIAYIMNLSIKRTRYYKMLDMLLDISTEYSSKVNCEGITIHIENHTQKFKDTYYKGNNSTQLSASSPESHYLINDDDHYTFEIYYDHVLIASKDNFAGILSEYMPSMNFTDKISTNITDITAEVWSGVYIEKFKEKNVKETTKANVVKGPGKNTERTWMDVLIPKESDDAQDNITELPSSEELRKNCLTKGKNNVYTYQCYGQNNKDNNGEGGNSGRTNVTSLILFGINNKKNNIHFRVYNAKKFTFMGVSSEILALDVIDTSRTTLSMVKVEDTFNFTKKNKNNESKRGIDLMDGEYEWTKSAHMFINVLANETNITSDETIIHILLHSSGVDEAGYQSEVYEQNMFAGNVTWENSNITFFKGLFIPYSDEELSEVHNATSGSLSYGNIEHESHMTINYTDCKAIYLVTSNCLGDTTSVDGLKCAKYLRQSNESAMYEYVLNGYFADNKTHVCVPICFPESFIDDIYNDQFYVFYDQVQVANYLLKINQKFSDKPVPEPICYDKKRSQNDTQWECDALRFKNGTVIEDLKEAQDPFKIVFSYVEAIGDDVGPFSNIDMDIVYSMNAYSLKVSNITGTCGMFNVLELRANTTDVTAQKYSVNTMLYVEDKNKYEYTFTGKPVMLNKQTTDGYIKESQRTCYYKKGFINNGETNLNFNAPNSYNRITVYQNSDYAESVVESSLIGVGTGAVLAVALILVLRVYCFKTTVEGDENFSIAVELSKEETNESSLDTTHNVLDLSMPSSKKEGSTLASTQESETSE